MKRFKLLTLILLTSVLLLSVTSAFADMLVGPWWVRYSSDMSGLKVGFPAADTSVLFQNVPGATVRGNIYTYIYQWPEPLEKITFTYDQNLGNDILFTQVLVNDKVVKTIDVYGRYTANFTIACNGAKRIGFIIGTKKIVPIPYQWYAAFNDIRYYGYGSSYLSRDGVTYIGKSKVWYSNGYESMQSISNSKTNPWGSNYNIYYIYVSQYAMRPAVNGQWNWIESKYNSNYVQITNTDANSGFAGYIVNSTHKFRKYSYSTLWTLSTSKSN